MATLMIRVVNMRLIIAASIVLITVVTFATLTLPAMQGAQVTTPPRQSATAEQMLGQMIFRFDTFGDEQFWTDVLRMPEALASVDPATALSVGLKVDSDALPQSVIMAIRNGTVDLKSPAVTLDLLRANAVVGTKGTFDADGNLTRFGLTCAFCHSTVDNSIAPGIGRRLDGWANRDLNVGVIVALSPSPLITEELKKELRSWGPGKYDPRHHAFNGSSLISLNNPSLPIVIPSIFGLRNVAFETFTGDGPISYWNSYVGVGQMGGHGSFEDSRIGLTITQTPDMVTPKLKALLEYQLSLRTPAPPSGSFDVAAARRGAQLFSGEARCATCHRGSAFTDVGNGSNRNEPFLHDPAVVGTDPMYAMRSATKKYRTTPLRALWQHPPYFHDGSAKDLPAVVDHYDRQLRLGLRPSQRADLVEYLKTL